jgi:hypothetical protein
VSKPIDLSDLRKENAEFARFAHSQFLDGAGKILREGLAKDIHGRMIIDTIIDSAMGLAAQQAVTHGLDTTAFRERCVEIFACALDGADDSN